MKTKNALLFFTFSILMVFTLSCNDDEGTGLLYESTCCEIDPIEATIGSGSVYVPNAFTPNFDGVNDIFMANTDAGITEINSLQIFQQNGTMVFERMNFQPNDPAQGWDGVVANNAPESDIFLYTLMVTSASGETGTIEGRICCRAMNDLSCVDSEENCAYATQHNGMGGFTAALPTFETCQ